MNLEGALDSADTVSPEPKGMPNSAELVTAQPVMAADPTDDWT